MFTYRKQHCLVEELERESERERKRERGEERQTDRCTERERERERERTERERDVLAYTAADNHFNGFFLVVLNVGETQISCFEIQMLSY